MDYAAARHNMVVSQIRPNKVTDPALIAALQELPRELFVPKALRGIAYVDEDIALADGRYLMEPMVLARLLQAAAVEPTEMALDVGCASGYSTAVLARLSSAVVGLESNQALAVEAGDHLSELNIDNAVIVEGPLGDGWPRQAPYDVILLGGRVEQIPPGIIGQLAEGGRLVTVIGGSGMGRACVITRHGATSSRRPIFDAAVRPLPGFERQQGFVF
ncbi:MAG: protein-L-isoaspartate O-methyltransferase [Kiloniellales bacterium]